MSVAQKGFQPALFQRLMAGPLVELPVQAA